MHNYVPFVLCVIQRLGTAGAYACNIGGRCGVLKRSQCAPKVSARETQSLQRQGMTAIIELNPSGNGGGIDQCLINSLQMPPDDIWVQCAHPVKMHCGKQHITSIAYRACFDVEAVVSVLMPSQIRSAL